MNVCAKCGRILQVDDEFCPKCGTPVQDNNNILDVKSDGTPMTKEESVELAEELANKYEEFNNAKKEIEDLEYKLKVTKLSDVRPRYHMFRFFWKYFIWSYVALLLSLIIGFLITADSISSDSYTTVVLISLAVYVGVLILGAILSSRKRDRLNIELEIAEKRLHEKRRQTEMELEEKKQEYNSLNAFLFSYNRRIPSAYRNKNRMRKVKDMIISDKAQSISEAISLYSGRNQMT